MQFLTLIINNIEYVVAIVGGVIAFVAISRIGKHKRYNDSVTEFIIASNRLNKHISNTDKPFGSKR